MDAVVTRSPSALGAPHAVAADLRACGRGGSGPMGAVLAARPPGYMAPASGLEARFDRILAKVRAARRRARRLLVSDRDPTGSRSDTRAS